MMDELAIPAARGRRPSLFKVSRKHMVMGSSILSHAYEPHMEENMVVKQPKVQYENTYRMEPDCKFPPGKVEAIMKEVLHDHLTDKTYNPIGCSVLCKVMTREIKAQVMDLKLDRYKVVCIVSIGEKKEQGVRVGSQCIWDTQRDNFAAIEFESPELFATAMTYAVYFE